MKSCQRMRRKKRRNKLAIVIAVALGCCVVPTAVYADKQAGDGDSPEYTLEGITVEAKRPDWESKLSPGTVTIINPDDYKGEQKTLPDMLKDVPGVHVREVNGKGQYTTVSVRGSTAAQVGIFVDGVLTNLGGDAAVDISTIPVKNVERIEVYRGYIPSRFGGTYMGGVINIVTKKPQKENVSAEMGRSSYGGATYSLQMDEPLGKGSLMVGINRDESDGDFKYENFASSRELAVQQQNAAQLQSQLTNLNNDTINNLKTNYGVTLSETEKNYYKSNSSVWESFVSDKTADKDNFYTRDYTAKYSAAQNGNVKVSTVYYYLKNNSSEYKNLYPSLNEFTKAAQDLTKRAQFNKDYATLKASEDVNTILNADSPYISDLAKTNKKIGYLSQQERYRRYNDYKNTDAILKWQSDHWTVKGTWKAVDRHLPDSLWAGGINNVIDLGSFVDAKDDVYYAESRRQKIDAKELMVARRDTVNNLEWGWMLNYLDQDKQYRTEKMYDLSSPSWNTPMREWSKYDSNRYNAKIDGTYKIGDNHMMEFLVNYSREKMNVDGSKMDEDLTGIAADNLARYRNYYEQKLFNAQVQDTITLDKKGTAWLTPSLRYNQSEILGRSSRMNKEDMHKWFGKEDEQTDGKATWQLALKKKVDDNFTMRMTGGTYYRLLNLYEVAGDGAGILPPPQNTSGTNSAFPKPEEGKQFDISALLNGKWFGSDSSNLTLTYFWRDADKMLQLARAGLDYWSYFNDNRGKIHGVELQNNYSWRKFDVNLSTTYTKMNLRRCDNTFANYGSDYTLGYNDIWATYQPEWEGALRLTWHPDDKFSVFGELKYVDQMFTCYTKDKRGGAYAYQSGYPQDSLTTFNIGIKWKPIKAWQFTLGCNDVFDKGPDMKIHYTTDTGESIAVNPEFPIQGRTFYLTAHYDF